MKHDFEDIEIKRNAVQILNDQLARKRKPCMVVTGSMCDPYIHMEEELLLTRQCLSLIEQYGFGLSVHTKSARIMRDIDILQAINEKSKCVVQFTLTTYDEELCQILEPDVSTTAERFAVLEAMHGAGIPTVVWICPILPFINDTVDNLNGLLDYCVRACVRGVVCFGFGTTMREGSREYFYRKLDEYFPGMKHRYIQAFGGSYECQSPNSGQLMGVFAEKCKKNGIMYHTDEVFGYLHRFETKKRQMTLFD